MAKGDHFTPHQKGIIRRYYDHQDDLVQQKLMETVSDLYLCDDEARAKRLWKSARTALAKTEAGKARVERICTERDLEGLAKLVGELF